MKRIRLLLIVCAAVSASGNAAAMPITDFFRRLFSEYEDVYSLRRRKDFQAFCASRGIDSTSRDNRRTYLEVSFFHDCFTCSGASNCARGGFLGIPYFWHWVTANPRHSIIMLPDSALLRDVPPPEAYARYKSRADIDRVPALYLGDLASDAPKYTHPRCGDFYTFGWCSEREMSFLLLMRSFGYEGKIRQSGIHTLSVLWCPFARTDGSRIVLAAGVDNTFDVIRWEPVAAGTARTDWLRDIGTGSTINWYNDVARSPEQLYSVRACEISRAAAERIRHQVDAALSATGD
jgi:hypothetical protein